MATEQYYFTKVTQDYWTSEIYYELLFSGLGKKKNLKKGY